MEKYRTLPRTTALHGTALDTSIPEENQETKNISKIGNSTEGEISGALSTNVFGKKLQENLERPFGIHNESHCKWLGSSSAEGPRQSEKRWPIGKLLRTPIVRPLSKL